VKESESWALFLAVRWAEVPWPVMPWLAAKPERPKYGFQPAARSGLPNVSAAGE
jgi:hypothetical protein